MYDLKISARRNVIYIISKIKASFFVNFFPVLIETRKRRRAAIKNILAITKGEKSFTSNGAISATIPKIKVELEITAPIKSPKIIQLSPRLAERTEKYASGKQFPKPIIKRPTKERERPNLIEKYSAELTIT